VGALADHADAHLEHAAARFDALALPFDAALARAAHSEVGPRKTALEAFTVLGARRHAERARRSLRADGVRVLAPRPARDSASPLTPRELEIARLVAGGLSNPEIADRLVLSVRTVTSHLEHVYGRLGIGTRTALARWITDHGG
jgi:DNA-binding NarL/FixJ family response regulator